MCLCPNHCLLNCGRACVFLCGREPLLINAWHRVPSGGRGNSETDEEEWVIHSGGTIKASRKNESYVLTSMGHKRLITVPLSHKTIESLLLNSKSSCSKRQQARALTKNIIRLCEKHCICRNLFDAGRKVCFPGWSQEAIVLKFTTNVNSDRFWRYVYTYNTRIPEIPSSLRIPKLLIGTLKNLSSRWMWRTWGKHVTSSCWNSIWTRRMSYWHTEPFSSTEDYLWRF